MRKAKTIISIFLLLTVIFSLPLLVSSSDPTDMEMTFITQGGFTLHVYHEVNDTQAHFIESILIEVNGRFYSQHNFTYQSAETFQRLRTNVGASFLDNITVTATCNQHGFYAESMIVAYSELQDDRTIPGFYAIGIISFMSALSLWFVIKRQMKITS